MTDNELSEVLKALVVVLDLPLKDSAPAYYAEKFNQVVKVFNEVSLRLEACIGNGNDHVYNTLYHHLIIRRCLQNT